MTKAQGPWTQFWDMHSGGGQKLEWAMVYIQASEHEAAVIFQNMFDRNPHRVTCTCCGEDYSLSESKTLEQATAYQRGCRYDEQKKKWVEEPDDRLSKKLIPLKEYMKQKDVKIVWADEIKPEHRSGSLREEGYVWR